ncbi:MATE family efflux transporter [Halomonas huangheensis]|uniref:Multidrug-efflux transporter n=1 Tax=Halomonas huangheensis TaxID=1178482 RepID=W1N703_9GAMM|nr:MATE family efflux transporter [Halomonas huangheensis]ALM54394.1 MATE family efflux transporter [Halomonas huangheensis]ERL50956.1 hypothetical protein BJB45_20390 [Halomonas huangheensis]
MTRSHRDLTVGSTLSTLIRLAAPIVVANMLQTAYQLIDAFWVGRLGANAVAAVSLSFPVLFLLISVGIGLAVAGTILAAQHYGRRELDAVNHVAAQAMLGMIVLSLLLAITGYLISPHAVTFLGASTEVAPPAADYLQISFLGMPFMFVYAAFQSLMRGVGDARTPLWIVFGTVVLNFILDPLLILGLGPVPAMGVSGAAVATVITQALSAVIGLYLLFYGRFGIQLQWHHMRPDLHLLWRLFALGGPTAVEQSTRALGMMLMTTLVAGFGTVTLAAYGIGTRLLSFVIIPALGLAQATSALVGQNIGAGKVERAEKTANLSALIAFVSLTVVGILAAIFAEPLVAIFVPDTPEVITEGALFLRLMALTFGLMGAQTVIAGAFRGAGDTMVAMIIALVSLWMLQFPLAWLLAERTSLDEVGIWLAYPIQNVVTVLVAWYWFRSGRWKQHQLLDPQSSATPPLAPPPRAP